MILYFADRVMNIKGQASTALLKGIQIVSDKKIEDIETGVASFECTISFNDKNRLLLEEMTNAGNYLLKSKDGENEFYTIIDTEIDTKRKEIYIYAEDAGLDLLNEIAGAYEADESHPITHYVERWIFDSGFEIGINEVPDSTTRKLKWDSETSCTERLASIATQFGDYEISYSFKVKGMEVSRKYVNIHKKRGKDIGIQLRLNRDIDRIITKKSVANLATAFVCTGGTPEEAENPITLKGYTYDDGDFYVGSDGVLRSRKAIEKWSRYVWNKEPNMKDTSKGHIWKSYSYDTTSQATLCSHAVTELKKICDMEINFEIELKRLPDGVKIGDRVDIVDDAGELYLSTRILRLETSEVDGEQMATLGEHLIKDSGITQRVEELAAQFSEIAKSRIFYTWVAYADDENGTGISLNPKNKDYLGIASNKLTQTVDISDPSIFEWSKIKGDPGESGTSVISILDQYYLSTSSTECIGGSWSETLPEWSSGHYIWERKAVTWSDGNTTYTDPILSSTLNHANEAAEFAQQQANTAAQSASSAQQSAANADTAAQTAADKATQAESFANTASDTATQAKSEAEAAQSAADKANKDIVAINNEIANVRKEVTEGLETVTETMSADYAKKTDLTDIQGNLQTQISKNAAGIETTAKSVEDVKIDASNAVANANEAKEKATTAQNTANTAKAEAEAAQTAADAASQAAQKAQAEATAAENAASTAKTAAENAQAVANAADKDLKEAKANLEAVTGRVGATEEEIAAAQEAVNAAQAAADKAKTDAATAKSAAETAQSTANTAKTNAANAQSAASKAQTDANNAKTAADKAQTDANKALADLATMGNRVTEAETKIQQNAQAIELTATKTEVAEQLNGYYTKTESDAKFTITPEKISSVVQSEVEKVKIGGKNLLQNTNNGAAGWLCTYANGSYFLSDGNKNGTKTCVYYCETKSTSYNVIYFKLPDNILTEFAGKSGEYVTLSFKIYAASMTPFDADVSIKDPNGQKGFIGDTTVSIPNYQDTQITITKQLLGQLKSQQAVYISLNGMPNSCALSIWDLKLEYGNKATDWTPAPEEMASKTELTQTSNSLTLQISDASKTATNYFKADTSGLTVGDHTGTTLKNNVLIGSDNVSIRNGTEVNAKFAGNSIELGKNSPNASVDILGGAFKIAYKNEIDDGGFGVYGKTKDNYERLAFQPINENGNLTLGFGGYAAATNTGTGDKEDKGASSTNIWGNRIYLNAADNVYIRPRYNDKASDAWEKYVYLSGHLQLANTYHLYGTTYKNEDGTGGEKLSLITLNSSNQTVFGFGSYDKGIGTAYYEGNDVILRSKNNITIDGLIPAADMTTAKVFRIVARQGDRFHMCVSDNTSRIHLLEAADYVSLRPSNSDKDVKLGTNATGFKWAEIWSEVALNTTSDRKQKNNIGEFDERYEALFAKLQPRTYKFINGKSGRTHTGFISQEVEEALSEVGLTALDFAAFCKDVSIKEIEDPETGETTTVEVCDENGNPEYNYSLRYEEFIALNTHMIQKLQAEKVELQDKVSSLEERLEKLETLIQTQ